MSILCDLKKMKKEIICIISIISKVILYLLILISKSLVIICIGVNKNSFATRVVREITFLFLCLIIY